MKTQLNAQIFQVVDSVPHKWFNDVRMDLEKLEQTTDSQYQGFLRTIKTEQRLGVGRWQAVKEIMLILYWLKCSRKYRR